MQLPPKTLESRIREINAAPVPHTHPELAPSPPSAPAERPVTQRAAPPPAPTERPTTRPAAAKPAGPAAPLPGEVQRPPVRRIPVSEPPKQDDVPLPHAPLDVRPKAQLDLRGGPGSLPVLEAFQEFLDEERKVMRRRFNAMAFFLCLVLACVAAGSIALGFQKFRRITGRIDGLDGRLATSESEGEQMAVATRTILSEVSETTRGLRNDLTRETSALADIKSDVVAKLQDYNGEMDKVRAMLTDVQGYDTEIGKLRQALAGLPDHTPEMTELRASVAKLQGYENEIRNVKRTLAEVRGQEAELDKFRDALARVQGYDDELARLKEAMVEARVGGGEMQDVKRTLASLKGYGNEIDAVRESLSQITDHGADLAKMKEELRALQLENSELKEQFAAAAAAGRRTRPPPDAAPPQTVAVKGPAPGYLEVTIRPRGGDRPLHWRLPTPE